MLNGDGEGGFLHLGRSGLRTKITLSVACLRHLVIQTGPRLLGGFFSFVHPIQTTLWASSLAHPLHGRDHAYCFFFQFSTFSYLNKTTLPEVTCSVHPPNGTYPHALRVPSGPRPKFWDFVLPIVRSLDITENPTATDFLPHPPSP